MAEFFAAVAFVIELAGGYAVVAQIAFATGSPPYGAGRQMVRSNREVSQ